MKLFFEKLNKFESVSYWKNWYHVFTAALKLHRKEETHMQIN